MKAIQAPGLLATLLCFGLASIALAQEKKSAPPAPRFGITADLETYPQGSAKQALQSVAKALDRKRIEYILAHLSDPAFVNEQVEAFGGKFDALVQETTKHFADNPKQTQEFRKFLTQGEVAESGTSATVTLKDVPNRQVTLRQIEGRWFINNEIEKK
jgi:hypothetical protein